MCIRDRFRSDTFPNATFGLGSRPPSEVSKLGLVQLVQNNRMYYTPPLIWWMIFSTRIKDAGIAIRHSRGRILFHTAGCRNGLKGLDSKGTRPKMDQFESKITKIKVSVFWMSGIRMFSRRRPMPACSPVSFKQSRPFSCNIWPR